MKRVANGYTMVLAGLTFQNKENKIWRNSERSMDARALRAKNLYLQNNPLLTEAGVEKTLILNNNTQANLLANA